MLQMRTDKPAWFNVRRHHRLLSFLPAEHAALFRCNATDRIHDPLWFFQAQEKKKPLLAGGEEEDGVWEEIAGGNCAPGARESLKRKYCGIDF
jgi:hypothetical protein